MTGTFGATRFAVANGAPILRSLGKPAAAYPGRVATDADLMIALDRQQTRLALPLNASDTSMTVLDSTLITANNLLTIDSEIVKTTGAPAGNVVPISRGFDGTTPALHLASAIVSGFVDAYHHNGLVAEIQAIENALGANLSKVPGALVATNTQYQFAPQTPGGALIVGNNSITLSPVPLGVNGSDTFHYLYIDQGTGTPEAALITGGAAVSGAASGTLIIQCANTHSGAWRIQTATAGIQEAVNVLRSSTAGRGAVQVAGGEQEIYAPIAIQSSGMTISGLGKSATVLQVRKADMDVFRINPAGSPAIGGITIMNLAVFDTVTTASSAGALVRIVNAAQVLLEAVILSGGTDGIFLGAQVNGVQVVESFISGQLSSGLKGEGPNCGNVILSNSEFGGQNLQFAGIWLRYMDGLWMSNVDCFQTTRALVIAPGLGQIVTNVFASSCAFDSGAAHGILVLPVTGGVVENLFFSNCWSATNNVGVYVDITAGTQHGFTWTGGTIHNNKANGASILGNARNVKFTGCNVGANSVDSPGVSAGIGFGAGVEEIVIQGCRIGTPTGGVSSQQISGVDVNGGTNIIVGGNLFIGDANPMRITLPATAKAIIERNLGVDEVRPAVASAATITLPINPSVSITGTTTILTISGGWANRTVRFVKTDAGTVTIGGGGNVPGVHPLAQNQSVTLNFDGLLWY